MGRKPTTKKSATRKPQVVKAAKSEKASKTETAKAAIGANSADPKLRELFLQHKPKIDSLVEQQRRATAKLRAAYKEAKGDGFSKTQFDIARQLSTPEGEAEYKTKISNELLAALYVGSSLGTQFDLFQQPDRTPAVDRAKDEGIQASMENKARKPSYAPATAQYEAWMKGYDEHQATLASQFKEKAPEPAKPGRPPRASASKPKPEVIETAAEDGFTPSPVGLTPTLGQPMSRAEFTRLQAVQAEGEPQSQFSKRVS